MPAADSFHPLTMGADDRLEVLPLSVKGGAPLFLRRRRGVRTGKPVVLIHGASAAGDTFLVPFGKSLFDHLCDKGFDVWILDWRGSLHVTAAAPGLANGSADDVASQDIPKALEKIRAVRESEGTAKTISVVAHCMGAACLAMAIGGGSITRAGSGVDRIVLSTIGLFYQVTWDGWAKVQDRVLERVFDEYPDLETISPAVPAGSSWPPALEDAYRMWPRTWGPPWEDDFFRRLAFLYGQPFLVSNLHPDVTKDVIRAQFGAVPFQFYRHGAQNALRGFAAPMDAEGSLPPETRNAQISTKLAETYLVPKRFHDFEITLLTGAGNPLWHRDSIDRMWEWLRRQQPAKKFVLDGYGHQDLWWGRNSAADVFPLVSMAVL
jgi:cholesterol oxidase